MARATHTMVNTLTEQVRRALIRTRRVGTVVGLSLLALGVVLFGVYFLGWVDNIEKSTTNTAIELVFVAGFTLIGLALLLRAWQLRDIDGSWAMAALTQHPDSIASAARQTVKTRYGNSYVVILGFTNTKSIRMMVKDEAASRAMIATVQQIAPRASISMV